MLLGDYLNIQELTDSLATKHIKLQRHPTLPLAILNYSNQCMFDDYWPDSVTKCRGLIINLQPNGEPSSECQIISLPFRKFFNLNHSSQPDYNELNLPKVEATVTEKMDGWFGIMWKYGEEYGIASRGSFVSPGAAFATQKLQKLVKYGAIDEFPKGYTPIFEIIFKEGKIVVDYPFEGLVLLALVNNETGEELSYDDLQKVWAKIAGYSADNRPWIRLIKAHRMTLTECVNADHLVVPGARHTTGSNIGEIKDQEGFVLTYPRPGTYPIKVKVKFEEYKRLHRLITGVTPQQIWKSLHDPMAEWLLEEDHIPNHFKVWAIDWRNTLMRQFDEVLSKAHYWRDEMSAAYGAKHPRKEILEELNRSASSISIVTLALLDGKIYEAYQKIWNSIRPVGRETETYYKEGDKE